MKKILLSLLTAIFALTGPCVANEPKKQDDSFITEKNLSHLMAAIFATTLAFKMCAPSPIKERCYSGIIKAGSMVPRLSSVGIGISSLFIATMLFEEYKAANRPNHGTRGLCLLFATMFGLPVLTMSLLVRYVGEFAGQADTMVVALI
jgi:hypothetical protein